MLRWRIYYEDLTTFDDSQGGPGDAPANGVVAINQVTDCIHHPTETFKNTEARLYGEDWMWWRPDLGCWLQGERDGLLDAFMHTPAQFAKQGRMTGHKRWEELWTRVSSDPDFPR